METECGFASGLASGEDDPIVAPHELPLDLEFDLPIYG
jgi:hypothetical protein